MDIKDCPAHYAGDGDTTCADAMRSMVSADVRFGSPMAYKWWTDALKYLWRFPFKNGAEDLEKCADCALRLRDEVYGQDE